MALIVRTYSSRAHPALFSTRCSNVGSCNLRPRMISLARGCVLSLPTLPTARHTKPEAGWRPQVSQAQQRRPLAWTCDCLCTALQSAVRERGYLHTAGPTLPRERQRVGSHELRASGRGGGAGAGARRAPPPSLPYKVDTSRPSLRTNWTRLVSFAQVRVRDGSLINTVVLFEDREARHPRTHPPPRPDVAAQRARAARRTDAARGAGAGRGAVLRAAGGAELPDAARGSARPRGNPRVHVRQRLQDLLHPRGAAPFPLVLTGQVWSLPSY